MSGTLELLPKPQIEKGAMVKIRGWIIIEDYKEKLGAKAVGGYGQNIQWQNGECSKKSIYPDHWKVDEKP